MRLLIKVVPGAASTEIVGWLGAALKMRVTAPAEGGKANRVAEQIIARGLSVPRATVRIVTGHGAARKTIEIEGLSEDEVRARLTQVFS